MFVSDSDLIPLEEGATSSSLFRGVFMALALSRISFFAISILINTSSTYFGMRSTGTLGFQLVAAPTVNTNSAPVAWKASHSLAE
jgi:hypothetical protein